MSLDPVFKSQLSPEFKISETGEVEAIFSTFDVVDRDGDIVTRESLAPYDGYVVTMVDSHLWGIKDWLGDGRISVGSKYAKFSGSFFMDTPEGLSAFRKARRMKERGKPEWSWSFLPGDVAYEERDGKKVRVIKSLAEPPFEVSPVLVGANQETRTLSVKSAIREALHDRAFIKELRDGLLQELTEKVAEPPERPDEDEPDDDEEVVEQPVPEEGEEAADPIPAPDGEEIEQQEAMVDSEKVDEPASEPEAVKEQELPASLKHSVESFLRMREKYREDIKV